MIEMMQTEDCLNSQTCCEGGRRPSWNERLRSSVIETAGQEDCTPDLKDVYSIWIDSGKAKSCEVNQVIQERMSLYGPPEVNLDCIARHWQAYLDNRNPGRLTLQDVCNMMCLAKLSRMARTPEHADSVKDIKAYRQIAESQGQ